MSGRIAAGFFSTSARSHQMTLYSAGGIINMDEALFRADWGCKSVYASGFRTCAIKADYGVECWGDNGSGQRTVPVDFQ